MTRFLVILLASLAIQFAEAQIPRTISYQGVLTDSLGNPKPDGTYTFTFSLYSVPSGGASIWSEQKTLPVERGLFHTALGDQVVIGTGLTFDQPYWLGIQVAGGPELAPRVPLTSVGHSLFSGTADTARYALRAPLQAYVDSARSAMKADTARSAMKADTARVALMAPQQGVVDSARIAGTVPANAITGSKVADGALTAVDIAANQVVTNVNGVRDTVTIVAQNGLISYTYADTIHIGFLIPYSGVSSSLPPLMSLTNTWTGAAQPTFRASAASSTASVGSFVKGSGTATSNAGTVHAENFTSTGEVLWLRNSSASNTSPVIKLHQHPSSAVSFVEGVAWDGVNSATRKFHITSAGTYVAGSDFSEAFQADGGKDLYEPGDVLVLADNGGKTVVKSARAYDHAVVGVYSTRPGVLGADKNGTTRLDPDDIPVAITGIVPTKVTCENGPVHPGDLLTTSGTPGHAMKATPRLIEGIEFYPPGAILGKALEGVESGSAVISVLVALR